MKKILFIGDCGNFKDTSNGVYAKNIQLFNRLNEVFGSFKHINTNNWKKNPSVLLNVLRFIWQYRKKDIIISLNTYSSYKLIKIVKMLFPSIRLNYFVIGGILPNFISQLEMKQRECYSIVKWFMVESQEMKHKMELLGYKNVIHIPNFKKIAYIPEKVQKHLCPSDLYSCRESSLKRMRPHHGSYKKNKQRNRGRQIPCAFLWKGR